MKNLRTAAFWVLSSFWMGSVGALSLGNISLLSKPGERLLAELEVKDISPVESNDLQAFLASPDLYSVARVTPSPELALIKTQFRRKPDGTAVIEFSSEQPLTSPSLDMLIEFRWATGRRVFMGNVPTQAGGGAAATAAKQNEVKASPWSAATQRANWRHCTKKATSPWTKCYWPCCAPTPMHSLTTMSTASKPVLC